MTLNALAVESEDLADHLAVRIARIRQVRSAVTGPFSASQGDPHSRQYRVP